MTQRWYVASTGDHQGLVIDEATGRNVAITYDKADAPPIAAAPDLRNALADMIEMATHHAMPEDERLIILRAARTALAKARGEG